MQKYDEMAIMVSFEKWLFREARLTKKAKNKEKKAKDAIWPQSNKAPKTNPSKIECESPSPK